MSQDDYSPTLGNGNFWNQVYQGSIGAAGDWSEARERANAKNDENDWKSRALKAEAAFEQVVARRDEAFIQRDAWRRVLKRFLNQSASNVSTDELLRMVTEEKQNAYAAEDLARAQKGLPPLQRVPIDTSKFKGL